MYQLILFSRLFDKNLNIIFKRIKKFIKFNFLIKIASKIPSINCKFVKMGGISKYLCTKWWKQDIADKISEKQKKVKKIQR